MIYLPRKQAFVVWLQPFLILISFVLILVGGISLLAYTVKTPQANFLAQPHLTLALSGAVQANLLLDSEETSAMFACTDTSFRFSQPATPEIYGLSWTFEFPKTLSKAAVFTLGATYPLSLHLLGQEGIYQTFTATEGELSFDPVSQRGSFVAYLFDEQSERVLASSSWVCH